MVHYANLRQLSNICNRFSDVTVRAHTPSNLKLSGRGFFLAARAFSEGDMTLPVWRLANIYAPLGHQKYDVFAENHSSSLLLKSVFRGGSYCRRFEVVKRHHITQDVSGKKVLFLGLGVLADYAVFGPAV
jgi:hypothetical protein